MKIRPVLTSAACFVLAAVALIASASAHSAEINSEPVMLVARRALMADQIYGASILIATPLGADRHMGFIVNKPTQFTLGRLFPEHPPSQKVPGPVYLGGPFDVGTLFALVQGAEKPDAKASLRLAPDLYAMIDRASVDRAIEKNAEDARFLVGFVLWRPGELRAELAQDFWYVLNVDTDLVLRKSMAGTWQELIKRAREESREIKVRAGRLRIGAAAY